MKKIFLFLFALSATLYANAQVTVTLQVDVSRIMRADSTIFGAGMRVGGTFATNGATTASGTAMLDWSPDDSTSAMTNVGDSIWAITINLPSANIGDTLYFKFVDGTWYSAGRNEDEGSDTSLNIGGCGKIPASGNNGGNRIFPIPSTGATYRWCYDSCTQCNGAAPTAITGVQNIKNISIFTLAPNPAVNKQSTLMYSVSQYSPVNISLYNVLGQSVKTFVNTNRPSGIYNQPINLSGLSSGIYFIQLTSGNQAVTRKITVQ